MRKTNLITKSLSLILAMVFMFTYLGQVSNATEETTNAISTDGYAFDVVRAMGMGWNLGNTLDSVEEDRDLYDNTVTSLSKEEFWESKWGNPITTKANIDAIKAMGFDSVRIPVTFYNHMDEDGNIDIAWLQRVEEVVNYVLDNDMYCIINVHHDTGTHGWLRADLDTVEDISLVFENLWEQYATYFKDYDEKLVFEGYNEILNMDNKWSWAEDSDYEAANQLNQLFVDTVRATGGNNATRALVVNTYAALRDEKEVMEFVLPTDTLDNHLIVSVHYYGYDEAGMIAVMERLNNYFVSKGVPVLIGEFGTTIWVNDQERVDAAEFFVTEARKYDIAPFWWDDGNYYAGAGNQANFGLYDRVTDQWYEEDIAKALTTAEEAASVARAEELNIAGQYGQTVKVEYIEFLNTMNEVDLAYAPTSTTEFILDMEVTSSSSWGNYLESSDRYDSQFVIRQESIYGMRSTFGWHSVDLYAPVDGERLKLHQIGNTLYVNDVLAQTYINQDFTVTDTFKLGKTKFKLYSFTILEKGKVVKEFVPVIDASGNAALYDMVDGTYSYPSNNYVNVGDVVSDLDGNGIVPEVEEPEVVVPEITEPEVIEPEITEPEVVVPEVTEPEVIEPEIVEPEVVEPEVAAYETIDFFDFGEVSSNWSIDTGLTVNGNSKIEMDFRLPQKLGWINYSEAYDNSCSTIFFRQEAKYGLYVSYGWYNDAVYKPSVNERLTLTQDAEKTYVNGKLVRTATKQDFTTKDTMSINLGTGKLYSYKIYEGDTLLIDLIPVKDSENVVCMYDLVSEMFFYAGR